MILIELRHKDGKVDWAKICRTELTAPSVIEHNGNFFLKVPVDPRIMVAGTPDYPLQYRQCRGEVLSVIIVVQQQQSEEVA
jgi:hypothetical protein